MRRYAVGLQLSYVNLPLNFTALILVFQRLHSLDEATKLHDAIM